MPIGSACSRSPTKSTDSTGHDELVDFDFFRRTSTDLCEAVLHPNRACAETMLRQYLARIDDPKLNRALTTVLDVEQPEQASTTKPRSRLTVHYGEGCRRATTRSLPPQAAIQGSALPDGRVFRPMLGAPFRSGTTHVMPLRPIFLVRFVPGWKQKLQQCGDGPTRKRTTISGQAREYCHTAAPTYLAPLPFRREFGIHSSFGPSN